MKIAIKAENLSKRFIIGHEAVEKYTALRDVVVSRTKKIFSFPKNTSQRPTKEEFWALKDINFEIAQGDRVGIIGRNGAGKSTLLKVLSRITEPTHGKVTLRGNMASLLEVGTGFHPELTGRENVFLNGAILGMSRADIKRKFDEIVAFAEVEKFLDTPVKRYSSGMYVRLAFSVAAHLESDILIVDEVLAVGDAQFQKKCLGKMQDVSKQGGKTVLFVSHDLEAVNKLTQTALLLKSGQLIEAGSTSQVIKSYIDSTKMNDLVYVSQHTDSLPRIKKIELKTSLPNNHQINGDKMEVLIDLYAPKPIRNACLSFQFIDSRERNYTHLWLFDSDIAFCRKDGVFQLRCVIPALKLYMGKYYVKCYFSEPPGGAVFEVLENVCPFEVVMYETDRAEFSWQPDACSYIETATWQVTEMTN